MTAAGTARDLVPLADRLRHMLVFRLGAAGFAVLAWALLPSLAALRAEDLAAAAGGYLLLSLAGEGLWRALGRRSLALVGALLLLDGVFLAWLLYVSGGPESRLGGIVLVHLIAVALLGSFRTGLKIALWHSLLAFGTFHALEAGVPAHGMPVSFGDDEFRLLLTHVAILWIVTITTASFAAVNERELRRRRHDLEALARLALQLESATEPLEVAEAFAASVAGDFGYERLLVLATPQDGPPMLLAHRGATAVDALLPAPGPGSVVERVRASGRTLLIAAVQPDQDGALAALLPGARNLVVIPLAAEARTVALLVAEHGLRRGARVERRAVAMLERLASQSALALNSAMLLDRLHRLAARDGLTGVANRRTFEETLGREISRASRARQPLSLVMLDIDHFKALNDAHGHQTGDAVLKAVARALAAAARGGDLVARYGGEEFAVILGAAGPVEAATAAERMRRAVEQLDGPVPVTASVGVATAPGSQADPADLVRAADAALYAAKRTGRNRSVSAPAAGPPRPGRGPDARPAAA